MVVHNLSAPTERFLTVMWCHFAELHMAEVVSSQPFKFVFCSFSEA